MTKAKKRRYPPERMRPAHDAKRLPEGVRYTRSLRFTLPVELADRLEALPKEDRDALVADALRKAH